MCQFYNSGNSKIGGEGCDHLIQAGWNNLTTLNLSNKFDNKGNSQIKELGCQNLSKSEWNNLTILDLSADYIIQPIIKLGNEDVNILAKLSG